MGALMARKNYDVIEPGGFFTPIPDEIRKATSWTGLVADPKTGELVKEPSMTKQAHKDECDINRIVKAFSVNGVFDHINEFAQRGQYVDLPDQLDYQQSLNMVMEADKAFSSLPAAVRERFGNDPAMFLAAMQDPEFVQGEAVKLGLATPAPVPGVAAEGGGAGGGKPPAEAAAALPPANPPEGSKPS